MTGSVMPMQATIVAGGEPTIDDDAVFELIDTGGVDGACVGYQRRSAVTGADASGACNRLPDAGRALSAVENGGADHTDLRAQATYETLGVRVVIAG